MDGRKQETQSKDTDSHSISLNSDSHPIPPSQSPQPHLLDGVRVGEDEEGEAAGPAGVRVSLDIHRLDLSELAEVLPQLLCGGGDGRLVQVLCRGGGRTGDGRLEQVDTMVHEVTELTV